MFLTTNSAVPSMAEENITCYKILKRNYWQRWVKTLISPFQGAEYVLNKKHETPVTLEEPSNDSANNYCVGSGFYSFTDINGASDEMEVLSTFGTAIYECIIPKGALYYKGNYNGFDAYASNEIIIQKMC